MEQLVTIPSILQNFSFFSNPNDVASFNQAKIWKKSVISNHDNIYLLINFFQETQLQPDCQIFVLGIIRDIIDNHLNSLQLSKVATLLSQTKPDILNNQSVTLMLGNLIGYITRFIYEEEHFFPFTISENQSSCTKLQWVIYHDTINYMDLPRVDCSEKQKNEFINAFKHEILISLFYLSISALQNISQAEDAIHLLVRVLQFDSKKAKLQIPMIPLDKATTIFLNTLQDQTLFEKFTYIIQNSHSPLSSDIVDLMIAILNKMTSPSIIRDFAQLIDMIMYFFSEILKMPIFFKDRNNINSIKNFFSSFPEAKDIVLRCDSLSQELITFLNFNLHNNYSLAVDILFSASKYFEKVVFYASQKSPLFQSFSNFFELFIESTLNALENAPDEVYNNILLDSSAILDMEGLIKSLFPVNILPAAKKNDCIVHLCNLLKELAGRPFNPVVNYQIGFIIFVMGVVINFPIVDNMSPPFSLIFQCAFNFFLFTNDKIELYGQILGTKFHHAFEYYSLFFLNTFCKLFFVSKELDKTIPEMKSLFETPGAVVVFVFQRFWNDTINNVCIEMSSKCLRKFIDISGNNAKPSSILDVISLTKYPSDFLSDYLVLPSNPIIYYTVINVMLNSEDIGPKFLNSLEVNFRGQFEGEKMKKLFEIFSSWFDDKKDSMYWRTTYIFFSSHFIDTCFQASSQSPYFVCLLKLLYRIITSLPPSSNENDNNPFDSNEPYSFQMVTHFMKLLTNITNEASQFLTAILVDDTIFDKVFVSDIFDSKPITLSESHVIGLNERQMKMKKSYDSSKTENISEDDAWSIIGLVVIVAKETLNSSISNFGIMEFYSDDSIFVFFDKLVDAISKTSSISFVSQEQKYKEMIEELSELIQLIVKNFRNVVVTNLKFSSFILDFIRVTFLSHNREVVKKNCTTLCLLINGFSKPEDIQILRNHFVLAFNAALYFIDCFSAREFVFKFTRLDPGFFLQIGNLIETDITQEVKRKVFHDNFEELWNKMAEKQVDDESQEMLNHRLKNCFKKFLDSITPHSIKLYSLPSLAQYFNFH
ncbi:hypothetical protein M9Y10_027424 [Tritrichomonas musculus]|uniref:Exportin-1 C-terminal domain-containing protein n=1 Tax=Tritrichomonas musculus TaxID=1915356 RepID=A0ABR2H4T0_9EUKA